MKFANQFSKLREAAIKAAPASKAREKEEREESLRDLLRWMLLIPFAVRLRHIGHVWLAPGSS